MNGFSGFGNSPLKQDDKKKSKDDEKKSKEFNVDKEIEKLLTESEEDKWKTMVMDKLEDGR